MSIFINPLEIPKKDFPLIVFSDQTSGLIEFFIKFRTKGDYNHVMWAISPNQFASQGNTYSIVPFSRYMKRGSRLKFVQVLGLSEEEKQLILDSINTKVKLPTFKKMYDWIGILGQAIGLKGLNIPGLQYCSEDVPNHLKPVEKNRPQGDPLRIVINSIPKHTSPQELNDYFRNNPEFKEYGKWEADNEISPNIGSLLNRLRIL